MVSGLGLAVDQTLSRMKSHDVRRGRYSGLVAMVLGYGVVMGEAYELDFMKCLYGWILAFLIVDD